MTSKISSSESDSSMEHLCPSRGGFDHQNISIEIIFMSSDDLAESRFLGDCWSAIRQSAPPSPIRRIQKVCFMISWFDKTFPVARGVYFALSTLGALLRSGSRVCPRSRFEAFGWTLKLKNHVSNLIWCTGSTSLLGHHASLKHMSVKLREREMALARAIPSPIHDREYCVFFGHFTF